MHGPATAHRTVSFRMLQTHTYRSYYVSTMLPRGTAYLFEVSTSTGKRFAIDDLERGLTTGLHLVFWGTV